MRNTLLFLILLFSGITHAFAICEQEVNERNDTRTRCLSVSGASIGVATLGGMVHPYAGLAGIIPGLVANNQCRIWQEKEHNLARCEHDYNAAQQAELNRQREILATVQRRNAQVAEVVSRYVPLEEAARRNCRAAIHSLMQSYIQQGRDLHDPRVQEEFRTEIQAQEKQLNAELQRLADVRKQEIDAI
jgi:hypothetical protein